MKKLTNLPSVTIGIPAFNEQENIGELVQSILRQKAISYNLESILVLSDGSSDTTDEIVKSVAHLNSRVHLIADGKRLGKTARLMQLYTMNQSHIFIQIDADVLPDGDECIEQLIKPFSGNPDLVSVSGDRIPINGTTLVERIILQWNMMWRHIRLTQQTSSNPNNYFSCILALQKSFIQTVHLNPKITSEAQLLYCELKKQRKPFIFTTQAAVYYKLPSKFDDYMKQLNRSSGEKQILETMYGKEILSVGYIPRKTKIVSLMKDFFAAPTLTIAALCIMPFLKFFYDTKPTIQKNGLWDMIPTTKSMHMKGTI